jgi:hypothetical protein
MKVSTTTSSGDAESETCTRPGVRHPVLTPALGSHTEPYLLSLLLHVSMDLLCEGVVFLALGALRCSSLLDPLLLGLLLNHDPLLLGCEVVLQLLWAEDARLQPFVRKELGDGLALGRVRLEYLGE